jgi:hypothetical protein
VEAVKSPIATASGEGHLGAVAKQPASFFVSVKNSDGSPWGEEGKAEYLRD